MKKLKKEKEVHALIVVASACLSGGIVLLNNPSVHKGIPFVLFCAGISLVLVFFASMGKALIETLSKIAKK